MEWDHRDRRIPAIGSVHSQTYAWSSYLRGLFRTCMVVWDSLGFCDHRNLLEYPSTVRLGRALNLEKDVFERQNRRAGSTCPLSWLEKFSNFDTTSMVPKPFLENNFSKSIDPKSIDPKKNKSWCPKSQRAGVLIGGKYRSAADIGGYQCIGAAQFETRGAGTMQKPIRIHKICVKIHTSLHPSLHRISPNPPLHSNHQTGLRVSGRRADVAGDGLGSAPECLERSLLSPEQGERSQETVQTSPQKRRSNAFLLKNIQMEKARLVCFIYVVLRTSRIVLRIPWFRFPAPIWRAGYFEDIYYCTKKQSVGSQDARTMQKHERRGLLELL